MKLRNKKTGEIWDIGKILSNDYPCWETLTQLCEDWEDVREPLIKDPKIRKAVRAWAEAIEANEVIISHSRHDYLKIIDLNADCDICFDYEIGYTYNETNYTIAELCGSEEIEILEPTYTTIEEKEKENNESN